MTKGKAYGANRDYQRFCQSVIQKLESELKLSPYSGDGIDITFPIAGTEVTFDVVLKDEKGQLVVIESKRYERRPLEQRDVFAFWGELEWLRKSMGKEVIGILVTSSKYRDGAINAAGAMGIRLAIYKASENTEDMAISFPRSDASVKGRAKGKATDVVILAAPAFATASITSEDIIANTGNNAKESVEK